MLHPYDKENDFVTLILASGFRARNGGTRSNGEVRNWRKPAATDMVVDLQGSTFRVYLPTFFTHSGRGGLPGTAFASILEIAEVLLKHTPFCRIPFHPIPHFSGLAARGQERVGTTSEDHFHIFCWISEP